MKHTKLRVVATLLLGCATPILWIGRAEAQEPELRHQLYRFVGGESQDAFGRAAVALGDLDGDGRGDFAVSAPRSYAGGRGSVTVWSGANGQSIYRLEANPSADGLSDRFGMALANLGDLDGDGAGDLLIGAPWDDDGGSQSGSCFVFSGRTGTLLADLNGTILLGEFGSDLAPLGDINFDGLPDFAIGASRAGEVRVVSGEWVLTTGQGALPQSAPFLWSTSLALDGGTKLALTADLDGDGVRDLAVGQPRDGGDPDHPTGRVILLSGASGVVLASFAGGEDDELGFALQDLGDVNGDGVTDLAVGIPGAGLATDPAPGSLRVFDGASMASFAKGTAASPAELWRADGEFGIERFGFALAAGDWNGDGSPDVAATAIGGPDGGFLRGFDGSTGQLLIELSGESESARPGWSVASAGDINGDGRDDLLLGAPRAGSAGEGALRAFSGVGLSLTADAHEISVDTGGTVELNLFGGPPAAGLVHLILGSASGTSPGLPTPIGILPLNFDSYTSYTISPKPELQGFVGVFDAAGDSSATLSLPAPLQPGLIGLELHYAWVALDFTQAIEPPSALSVAIPIRFISDDCSVVSGAPDCNGNGRSDLCDIADGTSADCNGNGIPDECDLASGTSLDLDHDFLPDECQRDRFVNVAASPGGDGSSWGNAWNNLSQAIAASEPYDRLWIAQGSYRLTSTNDSFVLPPRRALYGGFGGFETSLSQRDPGAFPTILTGDVNADDGSDFIGATENAWTVLVVPFPSDRSSLADGLTIRAGYSDELGTCSFWGVFSIGCTGGGVNCLGSPTFRQCIFEDNFGGLQGGGLFTAGAPTFERCLFRRNQAVAGGAVFTEIGGAPVFMNCTFLQNEASEGGAMASLGASSDGPRATNCLFLGNSAVTAGGALWALDVSPNFTLCTFHGNTTLGEGAVSFGLGTADLGLFNSILWGNSALGVFGEAAQIAGVPPSMTRCLVEGWTGQLPGSANHGGNPDFLDPLGADLVAGTGDEDLRLGPASAGIDNGNNAAAGMDVLDLDRDGNVFEPLPFDADGNLRKQDDPAIPDAGVGTAPLVDRGAYERSGQ